MPGTIQVSILELVGIPSVQSSSTGIKVTVGKQAHEAQEQGVFSFPLASFRDNLNVSVHDLEGNEIAHTAVETRSIVEKGIWEDLFSLKGGGHVRMRLQFVLTEDELKRIRSMRETATRKKQEDILKRRHSSADLVYASGGSLASSRDSLKMTGRAEKQHTNPAENEDIKISVGSDADILSKGHPTQKKQPTPAFHTSKSAGALDKLVADQPIEEAIEPQGQDKRSQLDKTPSNEMSLAISKTRSVRQISTTSMADAPARFPSLKRTIGANAKPAPISEGVDKVTGENQGYGSSIYEKQLVEKPERLEDLKSQNIDYMSSKKDVPKVLPATEEKKEVKDLEVQNLGYMSSKNDIPNMQPCRKGENEEKKELKLQNFNYLSSEKDIPEMQPTREEQKEEKKDSEIQNIDYTPNEEDVPKWKPARKEQREEQKKLQNIDDMSSKKEKSEMEPCKEEQKEQEKDTSKMQPTMEEQIEEKKDLELQNFYNMSSEIENTEMQPIKEGYKEEKKDTPIIQPIMEEKTEKNDLKLQNIVYLSSQRVTPKMQPTREENNVGKWDVNFQNMDCMPNKKDLPKMQTIREEAKEDNEGNIDYMPSKKDIPKIQSTREKQKEENKSPQNLHLSSKAESRNQSSTDISTEPQRPLFYEPLVFEKNWRSKHWKSLRCKVKSNMTCRNKNYISDRFHEWMFLDEMISSCIPSDDWPFIDLFEGWLSNCCSGTNQVKFTDSGLTPNRNEKNSGQRKSLTSGSSSNNGNSKKPFGQAVKIAIMVGFGVFVFLTRQRR